MLLLHLFITHLVIDFLLVNIYFFQEIILSLNRAALKFENFIVMGDFNIDVNASGPRKDNLDEFCNLFDLTNLVREVTCWTNNHRSTIDLILTNRPDSFQKTCTTETGISDDNNCISTFFKSYYYKNFNESLFLNDLEKTTFFTNSNCPNENCQYLPEIFFFGGWKTCFSKKENCKRQSSSIFE